MPTVDQVLDRRRERDRLRLRAALAMALAMHLGVGVTVAIGPDLAREEPPPLEFVKIRVVPAAALGTTRPTPPTPAPPAPKPPEPKPPAPEPPAPEPRPPAPEPEPPPRPTLPAPEPPERRPPVPQPARPAPSTSTPATSAPAPAAPAEPRQREGSPRGSALGTSPLGVAGVDNPNFTYDYYLDRMLALIESRWLRPRVEGPIEAMVHFRIGKDGRISGLDLVQSSGVGPFDLAALRAVEAAAPFPPLPTSYRSESLGVNLIVR